MATDLISTGWQRAIDAVVVDLLDDTGVSTPPVDSLRIAAALKVDVAFDQEQPGRARHKRIGGQGMILLKPDDRRERLQWATAHELGECFAWRIFERAGSLGNADSPGLREQVANAFAGRLLLPSDWFWNDVRDCEHDLLQLKRRLAEALAPPHDREAPPRLVDGSVDRALS